MTKGLELRISVLRCNVILPNGEIGTEKVAVGALDTRCLYDVCMVLVEVLDQLSASVEFGACGWACPAADLDGFRG